MRVSDNVAASRACAAGAKPARARIPARLAALAASLMLLAGVQPAHAQGAVAPDPASPTRAINPADLGF